ncbi:MAG: folate family ECF transporter S component [Clostridiales Family XIII bacterium]|jgi:ECF transporter S component (folate family)|nr:folate family ECF transporter S component [Clostridiales Family XIII bacterium]
MQKNKKTLPLSGMVAIALLMALDIILTRLLSINTPTLRISLSFLPVALISAAYGPLWAGAACVMDDVIGATLFPTGAFFPGFTLTALLTGLTFAVFLHRRPVTWKRTLPAAAIVCLFYNLCLDSFWLYIIMGKGFLALLPTRAVKAAVMLPLETVLIPPVWKYVGRFIPGAARAAADKTGDSPA